MGWMDELGRLECGNLGGKATVGTLTLERYTTLSSSQED